MSAFKNINAIKAEIVKYSQIENLKNFYISHPEFGSLDDGAFSRERSLPFPDLLHFLLYPRSKSTDIELLEFSHLIDKPNVNKSDFSKRRHLIPADYLKAMNRDIVRAIYDSGKPVIKLHGHLLLAGDGTTYSMPNTKEIKEKYLQGRKTGKGEQPLARGVVLKDVLNDIVVASNMECYGRDEISLLLDELDEVPQNVMTMSPVVILDRKFCAYTLLEALRLRGIGFIIRVKERFNAEADSFMDSRETTRDVTLTPASATIKKLKNLYGKDVDCQYPVRLVRLSQGVVVMTSVMDSSLDQNGNDAYHLRWNVETTIGFVKNNLQVEIFSASLDNSIRQDFNARTIQYNLLSALCHQAAELRHDDKDCRINRNTALGILKMDFGVLINKQRNFNTKMQSVLTEMNRFLIPIKLGRHNPRLFREIKHSGKYITLHNYREAI